MHSFMKTAGIAIRYDLEGNPTSAETSDEWLASHFRDTGTFMIPDRLKHARVDALQAKCAEVRGAAFLDELSKIAMAEMMEKQALDPRVTHSLVGAGLGAALGAGTGYVGTKALTPLPESSEEVPDNALRNAAVGGLVGGVAGGGLGFLSGSAAQKVLQRTGAFADDFVRNAGTSPKLLPSWEPPPKAPNRPVIRDFLPYDRKAHIVLEDVSHLPAIPVGGPVDHEAAKALQQAIEGRKDKVFGAADRLREPTLRMRLGDKRHPPGYIAKKQMQQREALARQLGLSDFEAELAGKGKYGAAKLITPEEVEASLQRYEKMQQQSPTVGQVGRYATLGAVAAPVASMLRNTITGGGTLTGAKPEMINKAGPVVAHGRALLGRAAAGALTSGAIPIIRAQLDRRAEEKKLRSFLDQYYQQQMHLPDGDGGELKTAESDGYQGGFTASEYSTPIEGPKRARQASFIPPGHLKIADKRSPETIRRAKQRSYGSFAGGALGFGAGAVTGRLAANKLFDLGHPLLGYAAGLAAPALGTYGGFLAGRGVAKALQGAPPSKKKQAGIGPEAGFTVSEYSGPLSYGRFPMESAQYRTPVPGLQEKAFSQPSGGRVGQGPVLTPTVKVGGVALTPRTQAAASSRIGKTPGAFGSKGPSIAQVAKPVGFGRPSAGAIKS